MRTKVTLVLLFLNVVLFYYIFEWERKFVTDRQILEARHRVFGPEVGAVTAFTRTGKASPTVHAEKRGEAWWLTQPYEWPARLTAISRILNELQSLEHETSFAVADLTKSEGRSLADYGLSDPAMTFSFTSGDKTYLTKIGDGTRIGSRLYLLSPDGTRVHVVSRGLADTLGMPIEDLRSPSIFTVPVFEVRSLGLQTAAPANLKVRLRREGDRWSFETPILTRADKNRVEADINALNDLEAKRFIEGHDADLDRTGLASPALRVTLEGNARRETLLIGNPAGPATTSPDGVEYFAKVEDKPAIFTTTVPQALIDGLRNAQETLRDTHILDFDPRNITALTLAAPGQPDLNLQRLEAAPGAEGWQIVARAANGQAPQTLPADGTIVNSLLQLLQHLAARKFLSDAPSATDLEKWGFNRPEREVTLNLNAPRGAVASTLTLQIGVKPDEHGVAYARLANAPFVYEIDPAILEDTPVLAQHFRQRLIHELPVGANISGLTLTEIGGATPIFSHQLPDGMASWDVTLALETEARHRALVTLLSQMRALRAKRFVADTFTPDHAETESGPQPWKYRLDVNLALTGGNGNAQASTVTLFLTDRLGGTTQIGGTADFGGVVFELTPEMVDALFALIYADKHDPGPPAKTPAEPAHSEPPKNDAPAGK